MSPRPWRRSTTRGSQLRAMSGVAPVPHHSSDRHLRLRDAQHHGGLQIATVEYGQVGRLRFAMPARAPAL
jgi:hypothetical protein